MDVFVQGFSICMRVGGWHNCICMRVAGDKIMYAHNLQWEQLCICGVAVEQSTHVRKLQ
jgi:hypothetical protein